MKNFLRLIKLAFAAALVTAASAQAAVVSYNYTATNGHFGSFSYDNTATSIGNGPFSCCGVAYNAISFNFDGNNIANPLLVIYQNYFGRQFAYFTDLGGSPYVQFGRDDTGLFASSAASEMDGRTLSDFANNLGLNVVSDGSALLSLTSTTSQVPEPGSLALMGLAVLGLAASKRRSKR